MINDIFSTNKPTPTSLVKITHACYLLQALFFVTCLSLFVALIINYIKYFEVRGTWLESHFKWQIRTFWYALMWSFIGLLTFIFIIGWVIWGLTFLWIIYRIVRGWLALTDGKPMYV